MRELTLVLAVTLGAFAVSAPAQTFRCVNSVQYSGVQNGTTVCR